MTFFDCRQFNVAEKPRVAGLPKEFEFEFVQRHVRVNRAGIREYVGDFKISDHVDHARFSFNLDSRALRNVHRQIDPVPSFAHRDLVARDLDVRWFDWRARRSRLQTRFAFFVIRSDD